MKSRKHILAVVIAVVTAILSVSAQKQYTIKFKNGEYRMFDSGLVDSMTVSRVGVDGKTYDRFVSQEIWTGGQVLRYELSTISQIGFSEESQMVEEIPITEMYTPVGKLFGQWYLGLLPNITDETVLAHRWIEDMSGLNDQLTTGSSSIEYAPSRQASKQFGQAFKTFDEIVSTEPNDPDYYEKMAMLPEVRFLRATWAMRVLLECGPIPLANSEEEMFDRKVARKHFDWCVAWICREFDLAAEGLPATRPYSESNRATSTMAKALKGRLLLEAASPFWNGSFIYPQWTNLTDTPADPELGTPDFGRELVSLEYNPEKWQIALDANLEALALALGEGQRRLMTELPESALENVDKIYVPLVDDEDFKKKVLLMRYVSNAWDSLGNHEILMTADNDYNSNLWAMLPHGLKLRNGYNLGNAWSGLTPTTYTVSHFYTNNGLLPEHDPGFVPMSQWYEQVSELKGINESIVQLHANREPRFYAWIGFDGGNYGTVLSNQRTGVALNMRDPYKQGFNSFKYARDWSPTGYLSQKFVHPELSLADTDCPTGDTRSNILMRLAEIYLNIAECYDALGESEKALEYLNIIRRRAGVPDLTMAMVEESGMTLTD